MARIPLGRRMVAVALASVAWSWVVVGGAPVAAQNGGSDLDGVAVDSPALRAVDADIAAAESLVANADERIAFLTRQLDEWTLAAQLLTDTIPRLIVRAEDAEVELAVARDGLGAIAAANYVHGGPTRQLNSLLTGQSIRTAQGRSEELLTVARGAQTDHVVNLRAAATEARRQVAVAEADLVELGRNIEDATVERVDLQVARDQAAAALPGLRELRVRERRLATVVGADFTLVTLEAYHGAVQRQLAADPGCGLRWEILAGIGYVESRHGTYAGGTITLDGTVDQRIIGIPLDGTNNTAAIPDTDGGLLDGDTEWDRAVGPMQFIPTTWDLFGRDGNGDGVADPHNIFDTTRAAASYLCRLGGVNDPARLREAILSYNASNEYVDAVLQRATRYDALGI